MASLIFDSPVSKAVHRLATLPLSPLVSGPLLLAATLNPDTTRRALSSLLSIPVNDGGFESLKLALSVLLVVGVLRWVNGGLNTISTNGWRLGSSSAWDSWPDEIIVVTGGSSGIGQDVVTRLAAMGSRVVILDIQPPLSEALRSSPLVQYHECDVTSKKSIAAAAEAIRSTVGHPTILVNNAGVANNGAILDLPEPSLRRIVGVNLMSHWFTTQEFLPHMLEADKGHIVTIASIASFLALPGAADYSATKAGAIAFHEALTTEIRHHHKAPGVLTTVIHPSYVRTPLLTGIDKRIEDAGVPLLDSGRVAGDIVDRIRSGRGGQLVIGVPSIISGIRGWPVWVQEAVRDWIARGLAI